MTKTKRLSFILTICIILTAILPLFAIRPTITYAVDGSIGTVVKAELLYVIDGDTIRTVFAKESALS